MAAALSMAVAGPTRGQEAKPPGTAPGARPGLAGRLLVAAPEMRDPRFAGSVICLLQHDRNGAMGLAVNRPLGDIPMARLLEMLDVPGQARGSLRVFWGGPVDARRTFVLHTPDFRVDGTLVVDGKLALSGDPKILEAIAGGGGPRRRLLALGYAGWAPGQLEAEIAAKGWVTAAAEESLVFADDPAETWQRALARRLLDL